MNKKTTRAFAFGIFFATTAIAVTSYIAPPQPKQTANDEKQYVQLLAERDELKQEIARLKHDMSKRVEQRKETAIYMYTLTIEKGDASQHIAKQLERANIISDAKAFISYLEKRGLSRQLRPGTYVVRSDWSHEQIASLLVK